MPPTPRLSILDFPPEITAAIFVHCVADRPFFGPTKLPWLSQHEAPLLLGRICRQWRDVALSTPELWNSIEVECPYFVEDIVPALDRWLLRSGNSPLTIDLQYRVHPDTSSDGILRLLKRHAHQLQTVTLHIPVEDVDNFERVVGPFPALRKLALFSLRLSASFELEHKISAFSIAPELRDVHFKSGFSPANITMPWSQLTTFRADTIPTSQFLRVLAQAPNLVSCQHTIYHATNIVVPVPPLLRLRKLAILGIVPSTDLLAQLTTPALVRLEVNSLELDRWAAFITRSGCALEHLAVDTTDWTAAMYTDALTIVPSVTELLGRRAGPSFYILFGLLNDSPHFLPNLKRFSEDCEYCSIARWPALRDGVTACEMLLAMLESRRRSVQNARLERFDLVTTAGLVGSAEHLRRLNALVDDGMTIDVEGSKSWGR
ncbi:hypothetical protein B0H15DRAFT_608560 [Mycena belliarum]|uniref:F-box domain-containing protein n=1 Tax=Mycena belliarum TaxID=1033014 RepID=A0AAD6TVH3_9AGAR|nr:hypothetical protein B0H15DRAFT_608560 [Mycena belliae]